MMENIDFEALRRDLIDYFGSAISFYPQALEDVNIIKRASNRELVTIALYNGFDLDDYSIYFK